MASILSQYIIPALLFIFKTYICWIVLYFIAMNPGLVALVLLILCVACPFLFLVYPSADDIAVQVIDRASY